MVKKIINLKELFLDSYKEVYLFEYLRFLKNDIYLFDESVRSDLLNNIRESKELLFADKHDIYFIFEIKLKNSTSLNLSINTKYMYLIISDEKYSMNIVFSDTLTLINFWNEMVSNLISRYPSYTDLVDKSNLNEFPIYNIDESKNYKLVDFIDESDLLINKQKIIDNLPFYYRILCKLFKVI